MGAIRMLNSPPAQYPHRFNVVVRFPGFSRRDPREQRGGVDGSVLHAVCQIHPESNETSHSHLTDT